MAGTSIRIDIDDREVKRTLERLLRRTDDLSDPMRRIVSPAPAGVRSLNNT